MDLPHSVVSGPKLSSEQGQENDKNDWLVDVSMPLTAEYWATLWYAKIFFLWSISF